MKHICSAILKGTIQDEDSKRDVSEPGTEALAGNLGGLQIHPADGFSRWRLRLTEPLTYYECPSKANKTC